MVPGTPRVVFRSVHGLGADRAVARPAGGWSSGARRHGQRRHLRGPPGRYDRGAAGDLGRHQHVPGTVTGRAVAGLWVGRVRGDRRSTCGRSPRPARPSGRSRPPAGASRSWSKSGRQLYYLNGKNELVAADIRPGTTFAVGEQRVLFSFAPFLRLGPIPSYGVSGRPPVPDAAGGGVGAGERAHRGGALAGRAQGEGRQVASAGCNVRGASPRQPDPRAVHPALEAGRESGDRIAQRVIRWGTLCDTVR